MEANKLNTGCMNLKPWRLQSQTLAARKLNVGFVKAAHTFYMGSFYSELLFFMPIFYFHIHMGIRYTAVFFISLSFFAYAYLSKRMDEKVKGYIKECDCRKQGNVFVNPIFYFEPPNFYFDAANILLIFANMLINNRQYGI